MKILNAKLPGRPYFHFDANCGSGWNEEVNVPGSPLVFWDRAEALLTAMRPIPFFCDIDLQRMETLKGRLSAANLLGESYLIPGDNQEAIQVFAEYIRRHDRPQFAVGTVLVDPNGYWWRSATGIGVPSTEVMRSFCEEFPRIDVVLNLNKQFYHRAKGLGWAVLEPRAILAELNRSHWIVGQAGGQSRHLLAIGRNFTLRDHPSIGLYCWNSSEGGRILDLAKDVGHAELPQLPGISGTPGVSRGTGRSHAQG